MWGWVIIFAFWGLGVVCNQWLHIPFPGNLLGMLFLVVFLAFGWIKLDVVEKAASFLMKHMLLFFVPIMVGVSQQFHVIEQNPWPILLALTVGTAVVMLVSGTVMERYMRRKKAKESQHSIVSEEGEVRRNA
ncbi:CidA/LrgA family protein [Brevibacillus fluminis]|uniref:CidA/LrgA family protein n=1 Tax=Brevibacillus fluminis TaxID=511487 RepID=UPI003F8A1C5B